MTEFIDSVINNYKRNNYCGSGAAGIRSPRPSRGGAGGGVCIFLRRRGWNSCSGKRPLDLWSLDTEGTQEKPSLYPVFYSAFHPAPYPAPERGGENFDILLKDRSTKGHLQGKNMDKMDCSAFLRPFGIKRPEVERPLRLPKNYFATP